MNAVSNGSAMLYAAEISNGPRDLNKGSRNQYWDPYQLVTGMVWYGTGLLMN